MINKYVLNNNCLNERDQRIYRHSHTVANAAKLIAERIQYLDSEKAYQFGLLHDIGKFGLAKEESYKHPRLGYELMLANNQPEIAVICISHAFPNLNNYEHVLHYCHNDKDEADKVFDILKSIETNDYIELIQFCDKISTADSYVSIDSKLKWYLETYNIPRDELVSCYESKLLCIKDKFSKLVGIDLYDVLKIKT